MKKRIISIVLVLAMCVGLFPAMAQAAEYTVTEVIPCKYDQVTDFSEGLAAAELNGEWSIIDKTGKEVASLRGREYSQVYGFCEGLAVVMSDVPDTYDEEGFIIDDISYGFIDRSGKEVIPCKYTYAEPFSEGLALVREGGWRNGRQLFIDKTGKEVISCDKYKSVESFSEGLALVQKGEDGDENSRNSYGFIDKTGKEVITCQYIDAFSREVVACRYKEAESFSEGLACIKNQNGKYIYIDKTGKEVLACGQYNDMFSFSEGLARAHVSWYDEALWRWWFAGKWSYINKDGEEVIPCRYDYGSAHDFSEGLAGICNDWRPDSDGKWGFIDKTGEEVIPCKYDWVNDFSEGFALVELNGKYGYIDKAGKEVVPFKYRVARDFSEGLASVIDDTSGGWGYISIDVVSPFGDVKSGDYYADAVQWAVEKGVTTGTSQTTFSPNENCTVAQILTFLWRANGSPKPTKSNPFSDVKSGDYYADAAAWAYEKGIVSGRTFGGGRLCTRSMAVTYMWKAAGSPSAKAARFSDVPSQAEYANAVSWAVEKGVTTGISKTTFAPNEICTRGQIVTFLYRGLA